MEMFNLLSTNDPNALGFKLSKKMEASWIFIGDYLLIDNELGVCGQYFNEYVIFVILKDGCW